VEELDKDESIITVLKRLRSRLGRKAFVIQNRWNDRLAIGIESPFHAGVMIYIATNPQDNGYLYYELEIPSKPDNPVSFDVVGRGSVKSFEELVEIVAKHLRYYG